MSNLNSLALAIDFARRKRDQAELNEQQAQRAVRHAQDQMAQLESYAADTDARWATATAATVSATLMQHHQQFMERLRHAVGMQQGVLQDLQRQADAVHQHRVQEEVRLAALERLLQSKQAAYLTHQARKEQKQMDELATLKFARRTAGLGMAQGEAG